MTHLTFHATQRHPDVNKKHNEKMHKSLLGSVPIPSDAAIECTATPQFLQQTVHNRKISLVFVSSVIHYSSPHPPITLSANNWLSNCVILRCKVRVRVLYVEFEMHCLMWCYCCVFYVYCRFPYFSQSSHILAYPTCLCHAYVFMCCCVYVL